MRSGSETAETRSSQRANARGAQVDAARIVDASVEILTDKGLDALSIRSVAAHLGLSPMSIYRYVESKSDLLDAVVLRILNRMEIPHSFAESWSERIVVTMTAWRDLLLANPSVIPILVVRPIPAGSEGLARIEENILANLEVAGITGDAATQAFWQIFTLTFGQVVFELPRRQLREEDMDDYAESMSNIARDRGFDRVRDLAPKLVSMKGRGTFEQAMSALLRGLQHD